MMVAMTHGGYVATGWIGTGAVLGVYAVVLQRRTRRARRRLPPEDQPWT